MVPKKRRVDLTGPESSETFTVPWPGTSRSWGSKFMESTGSTIFQFVPTLTHCLQDSSRYSRVISFPKSKSRNDARLS